MPAPISRYVKMKMLMSSTRAMCNLGHPVRVIDR